MSDIALVNKDLVSSNFGDIAILDDNDDVIQMAINNILTIRGTNEFHTDVGNDVYNGRYKMSDKGLQAIASECKNAILQDIRVSDVIEIIARNASTIDNYGLCEISFVLVTIDGVQLSSNVAITL